MFQRMEEKQAELENPVEGWNLSVKDVRKILSRKHRHRRSASNDDVIREGDYPMDDDDDEEEEEERDVGGAKGQASAGEERSRKEPIAEFPISSSRHTRSSTSSRDRRQPEHHHHHHQHHHHHHREHRSSSSSSASAVSPVISVSPVMLAAAAASVDPSSRANLGPSPGKKAPPTSTSPLPLPSSAQKQPPPPIPQPSALPPPHLKTPVTMVISRDPRVAKRQQQQLLEKTQQGSSNQQAEVSVGSKTGSDSKSPSPVTEASPQKSSEADEARIRERLLLRQKYRIRKASDRRDSKDDSPEDVQQSPTASHPPPPTDPSSQPSPTSPSVPSAPAPIKSCLVKGSSSTPSNVNTSPAVEPDAQSLQQEQVITARPTALSEQGGSLHPPPQPRQQGFGSSAAGESVEQCTGELELSPHKKAVFVLDAKAAPVDVTSLPPAAHGGEAGRVSTAHEVLPDSRVEPETGEVESMNMSSQVPSQAPVGTGSSVAQAEATPTTTEAQSRNDARPESDEDEKDDSSDSSDEEDRDEREGGAKQAGGVAIGKCYMDQEGAEEEEVGVASDKETKEER